MKRRLANLTEIEQLDYLVDVFKSESAQYSVLETCLLYTSRCV